MAISPQSIGALAFALSLENSAYVPVAHLPSICFYKDVSFTLLKVPFLKFIKNKIN